MRSRKTRHSFFAYTELEPILRTLGTNRLIVCGFQTNVCVEAMVRAALERNFEVAVAEDAVATDGPDLRLTPCHREAYVRFDKLSRVVKRSKMVDEQEREQAILDVAAELLLRLGYNKLTMGDVAEAVGLHRGLVYLRFKSKDELVEAVARRELDRYAELWSERLRTDPRGGSVASVYRAMAGALRQLPLAGAIVARDEDIFGKYLRRSGDFHGRIEHFGTREFVRMMQDAGAVRADIDADAVAFILDSLTPALRDTFQHRREQSGRSDLPTTDAVVDALSQLLELGLTPSASADLEPGKALLLDLLSTLRGRHPA
ncbi:isochorismatase family protein [Nocardia jinanensis]|uniref:isochorismatase family protein n=1 Tax=Nocardia jinanensis TaxID=382504 RepID=UPI0007A55097|nr:isochorismatase family protein [Nocardia jinanensis]